MRAVDFDELPPHVQEAIRRREAFTSPIFRAIDSLGLTWEIAGGNLTEIYRSIEKWEGDGWRRIHLDGMVKHSYHRELLRVFHNFLSSAMASVWHAERMVGRLKTVAPELSEQFGSRVEVLAGSDAFLLLQLLRDYAIHTGHHVTVLTLQGGSGPTGNVLIPKVGFDVEVLRVHLQAELLRAARSSRKRERLQQSLEILDAAPPPEMRQVVRVYHKDVGGLLGWLRQELIALNRTASSRPLKKWSTSPETWIEPPGGRPTA
jgi:hypothetical protein